MGQSFQRCLHCDCLGERMFGQDVDVLFAYPTPKVVKIRDRTLGITRIVLMLVIFVYIFVFTIWYQGKHFQLSAVEGMSRLQWQQPTTDWCNPSDVDCTSNYTSPTELPYCEQYAGKKTVFTKRPCVFFDAIELPVIMPGGVLMPTYVEGFQQHLDCAPGDSDCDNKWVYVDSDGKPQAGRGEAKPTQAAFVADVEDFTLLIDHSFRTVNGEMAKNSVSMHGYFQVCDEHSGEQCRKQPIRCSKGGCPDDAGPDPVSLHLAGSRGRAAKHGRKAHRGAGAELLGVGAEEREAALERAAYQLASSAVEPDVFSIRYGDVMSLRTILGMAGIKLEDNVPEDGKPESLRFRGGAISIRIEYSNQVPWTLMTPPVPEYTIKVTSKPIEKFKHRYVKKRDTSTRDLRADYGIYIVVEQTGQMRFFNPTNSLVVLTSALGLVMLANSLTDTLALMFLPRRELYNKFKYELTEDVPDAHKDMKAARASSSA